jgi:hypothetical protein
MEKKTLIQSKKYKLINSSSGRVGYERHNTEVDGRMYIEETKIINLVEERQANYIQHSIFWKPACMLKCWD